MEVNSSVEKRVAPRRSPTGAAVMQPRVTSALIRALFREWALKGYGALSLEAVARRAGVGKAALYRRWPSKLEMATDCIEQIGVSFLPTPDMGSLVADIDALLRMIRRQLRHKLVRSVVADLHAEMTRNSELAQRIRGRVQVERRARGASILKRAMVRGEIAADVDVELVGDAMAAMLYWRLVVLGKAVDDTHLEHLKEMILRICPQAPSKA